ncbi:F-box/FBD/LRR-repeat protein [Rosa sericea]
MDRISNLPVDVTHRILCKLSIKEAVRTTVLSRNWKHNCDMLPHVVFDDRCCVSDQKGKITKRKRKTKFCHIVDQVFSLQENNTSIVTFKVSHQNKHVNSWHIDRWIRHLSRTSVRTVILEQWEGSLYNVSSRLFSCQDLEYLELYGCFLKIPSSFEGFGKLKSLNIQKSTVDKGALKKLICCCPLLASLILYECKGITHLNIDAPNLKYLDVEGAFEDLNIENSLNLVYVAINQLQASGSCSNLLKYFVQLSHLNRLKIQGCFLQCAVDSLQDELPKPYLCLKSLCLSIRLANLEEILAAIRLLRSSPALQDLELSVRQGDGAAFAPGGTTYWLNDNQNWDEFSQLKTLKVTSFSAGARNEVDFIKFLLVSSPALRQLEIQIDHLDLVQARKHDPAVGKSKSLLDDFQNCSFTQLRVVRLTGISGVQSEVGLITFLLRYSPELEKMTVRPASVSSSSERELFKKLLQLRRASVKAEIEYLDPLKHAQRKMDSKSESETSSESDSDSDSDSDSN